MIAKPSASIPASRRGASRSAGRVCSKWKTNFGRSMVAPPENLKENMEKHCATHHALEALDAESAREIEDTLWWVQGRKDIIRRHLRKIAARFGSPKTIMDIGCGSGGNLDVLAEFGSVIGVEPSPVLAERSRLRSVAKQVYERPAWEIEETHSVSLFTMFDVLEHIEDDRGFLT